MARARATPLSRVRGGEVAAELESVHQPSRRPVRPPRPPRRSATFRTAQDTLCTCRNAREGSPIYSSSSHPLANGLVSPDPPRIGQPTEIINSSSDIQTIRSAQHSTELIVDDTTVHENRKLRRKVEHALLVPTRHTYELCSG
jgi:hypothetical protein